jgi:surfactin synthase thioesterase subunit
VNAEEAKAWSEHTTGAFDLRMYPGGHFYLVEQGRQVTQMLADDLAQNP